jgi:hypothetical protein
MQNLSLMPHDMYVKIVMIGYMLCRMIPMVVKIGCNKCVITCIRHQLEQECIGVCSKEQRLASAHKTCRQLKMISQDDITQSPKTSLQYFNKQTTRNNVSKCLLIEK